MEPRSINARAGRLSRPEQHSWFSVLGIKSKSKAQASNTSILPPCSSPSSPSSVHPSNTSSFQSYYTANSALSYSTMNSASMRSSEMSSPYSVTSINSRKSRMNVLYPRRVHPLPVAEPSEHSLPPGVCFIFRSLWLPLLNTYSSVLRVGPYRANPVLLYALGAARRDPSNLCGKSAPPVIGA